MIKLKISMADGKAYRVRNLQSNSVYDFIKNVLMKGGTENQWYEVLPTEFIRISQITSIEKLDDGFGERQEDETNDKNEDKFTDEALESAKEQLEAGEIPKEPLQSEDE